MPPTVEKVILARLDGSAGTRLGTAASALGRRFALPLLEGVLGRGPGDALHELQRLGLVQQSRRWPQPEYRFRHALIQETAYRTLLSERARSCTGGPRSGSRSGTRSAMPRRSACSRTTGCGPRTRRRPPTTSCAPATRRGQEYALDEAIEHYRDLLPLLERRGERQEIALVLFKLALALHTSLRFAEANEAYQRAFAHWTPPEPRTATERVRVATSFLPNDLDPKSPRSPGRTSRLCMQLFDRLVEAWPERTIVPSLAERWEISDDGLRYVFHLREGLTWSDGTPFTAHDVEFGIKRVLDPESPAPRSRSISCSRTARTTTSGRNSDADAVGVRALDDRPSSSGSWRRRRIHERDEPAQRRPAAAARDREGERWTGRRW